LAFKNEKKGILSDPTGDDRIGSSGRTDLTFIVKCDVFYRFLQIQENILANLYDEIDNMSVANEELINHKKMIQSSRFKMDLRRHRYNKINQYRSIKDQLINSIETRGK
jgi:hypothetical protein